MPQVFSVGSRSIFVSFMAWAVIVLASFGLASALRALLGWWLLPSGQGLDQSRVLMLVLWMPLAVAALVAAAAMLARFEWGRRLFMAVLVASVSGGLCLLWLRLDAMALALRQLAFDTVWLNLLRRAMGSEQVMLHALCFVLTAMIAVACIGAIQTLRSRRVRQEFA